MFDTTAEIELGMRLTSGASSVVVRWPTDEEWAARSKARKIIIRRMGRGISETVPPEPSEGDVALYKKIALNGTPEVTKGEAYQIAEAIAVCNVTGVEVDGDNATVDMNVLTGHVKHLLKVPTADQVVTLRRSGFRILELPFNQQEVRISIEPGAKLWDALGGKSDDYAHGTVPNIHKDTAVRAVIDYIDRNLGPRGDDANF